MEETVLELRDGFRLSLLYAPVENSKAVFQLCHGAWEHKERYQRFIDFLNSQGYSVVIADQRGHGKSVTEKYPHEYMENYDLMVEDQYEVTKWVKAMEPEKEVILFGHSMGSMIARLYLREHDDEINKVILTGTANPQPAGGIGAFLAKFIALFKGKHGHSNLVKSMSGLDDDLTKWLSYDQDNIARNIADKEELTTFDLYGYATLYSMATELCHTSHFKCKNPDLKILTANGKDDPVTGFEKGLKSSVSKLNKAGYKNIKVITYENMMHEVLNETEHQKVYDDIIAFVQE